MKHDQASLQTEDSPCLPTHTVLFLESLSVAEATIDSAFFFLQAPFFTFVNVALGFSTYTEDRGAATGSPLTVSSVIPQALFLGVSSRGISK